MANHGAKFVSVNLNKSYGQQHHPSHYSHFNGGGGSYGQAATIGRGRPGSGGGGGMLVLSRNRGVVQKVAPKLSVPPPLNLPSLRKEHEKFDMSGPGGPGSSASTGSEQRPISSGLGWMKHVAAATTLPEKNESGVESPRVDGTNDTAGATRGTGSYMPPSTRCTGVGLFSSASASRDFLPFAEKAMLLRGEDFPSLQAARPASSGTSQKHMDSLSQKQKQVVHDELTQDKEDNYHLGPMADAHPLGESLGHTGGKSSVENCSMVPGRIGGQMADQTQKHGDFFPDPLPLVHMNPRSDWADDERDTEGKEVNSWRTSPLSKDGFSSQEMGCYRVDVGARMANNNNLLKENKYVPPRHGDTVQDSRTMLNRDSTFGRRYNQNSTLSKPSLASSGRRPPITDPILTMGRDKRFSNNDKPFLEDPFLRDFGSTGFDERDIFSDGLVGVIKRKKDAAKSTDFHDPVRESFEAELERVQKIQELERQRIIEEQERALEQVGREEEERQKD